MFISTCFQFSDDDEEEEEDSDLGAFSLSKLFKSDEDDEFEPLGFGETVSSFPAKQKVKAD